MFLNGGRAKVHGALHDIISLLPCDTFAGAGRHGVRHLHFKTFRLQETLSRLRRPRYSQAQQWHRPFSYKSFHAGELHSDFQNPRIRATESWIASTEPVTYGE